MTRDGKSSPEEGERRERAKNRERMARAAFYIPPEILAKGNPDRRRKRRLMRALGISGRQARKLLRAEAKRDISHKEDTDEPTDRAGVDRG